MTAPPRSRSVETFAPKRRLRSPTARGGLLKDAESIAEAGNFAASGAGGGAVGSLAACDVIVISSGVMLIDVTTGRPIGGYAPRASASCTTSASPGGGARASSRIGPMSLLGGPPSELMMKVVPFHRPGTSELTVR